MTPTKKKNPVFRFHSGSQGSNKNGLNSKVAKLQYRSKRMPTNFAKISSGVLWFFGRNFEQIFEGCAKIWRKFVNPRTIFQSNFIWTETKVHTKFHFTQNFVIFRRKAPKFVYILFAQYCTFVCEVLDFDFVLRFFCLIFPLFYFSYDQAIKYIMYSCEGLRTVLKQILTMIEGPNIV